MKKLSKIKNSLTLKFVLCLTLFMFVPFSLILILTSRKIAEDEHDQTSDTLRNNLEVISLTVDHRLSNIEALSNTLLTDSEFTEHVTNLGMYQLTMTYEDYLHIKGIKSAISSLTFQNDDIDSVFLYNTSFRRFFNTSVNWDSKYNHWNLRDYEWYTTYLNMEKGQSWHITTSPTDDEMIVCLYRSIKKPPNQVCGIYSVNVHPDTIKEIMSSANPYDSDSFCLMVNESGQYISTRYISDELISAVLEEVSFTQKSGTTDLYVDDTQFHLGYHRSEHSGFYYVLGINQANIVSTSSSIHQLLYWYILDILLILLIFMLLVYMFFLKPLNRLSSGMVQSQAGDFSARLPEHSNDEISQINHRFNRMNQSIEELINENYIKELDKRTLELKLLGNQINEHFLYNTLDSIHWMARKNDDYLVSQAIYHLSDFYRISLSYGSDMILVSKLKQMLESYLFLQKIRHMDHMHYEIQIDEELLSYSVPKHLFIPLIENAITHGIRNISDGVVCVNLTREGECMRFQVTDNGNGISEKRMKEIMTCLEEADFGNNDCFALKNLNRQLQLHFKNSDGIHMNSTQDIGTIVWFMIPIERDDYKC